MFRRCYDIIKFDYSKFNTSLVTNMFCIFFHCSLTSLNLSKFYVENITITGRYSSLKPLNLFFNTSKGTHMNSMLSTCTSLISLNLSYFDALQVIKMNDMFP